MSKKASQSRIRNRQRVEGALRLREQDYPFVVYRQVEELGPAGKIDYWYMLPTELRSLDDVESIDNFRSCIDYWLADGYEAGVADDWDILRTYVLAFSYAVFHKQRGLQQVFRDAFLKPGSIDPSRVAASPEDLQRIREVVALRDHLQLKQVLDHVFEARMPSSADMEVFARGFVWWVDKGVNEYRLHGGDGLERWLEELNHWVGKYRKDSKTQPRVRAFVNFFGYRAKISFYLCYANFWANLIPWLKEHHGLDEVSARFLRVWHNQNPPIRIPLGRTAGGIIYPNHGRARLLLPSGKSGRIATQEISWKTPQPVPEQQFDVFSGQVLALHPLTWFFFADEIACGLAGRLFRIPEFDFIMSGSNAQDCAEYWEMVRAILFAAYTYRNARNVFENSRHMKTAGGDSTLAVARDDAPAAIDSALRDYIRSRGILCSSCNERLEYDSVELSESDDESRPVHLKCPKCGATSTSTVTADDFEDFLKPDE